jgi:single-stranded-DNA-specific exonuclease
MSSYFTKLVGVTFEGRQLVIRNLRVGQVLYFVREPNNPFDSYAVNVKTADGQSVGFISKDYNQELARQLDSGMRFSVHVSSITGGDVGMSYGVNIEVKY